MKTIEDRAFAYVEAVVAARESGRKWRELVAECSGGDKTVTACLFDPRNTPADWCELCNEASVWRREYKDKMALRHSRLRSLVNAVKAREGAR